MKEKEFSETEKVEIYLPKTNYQLAERLGYLCGYEQHAKEAGRHFRDEHVRVILHVVKVEFE